MSLRSTTTRRSRRHRLDEWFLSRKVVQLAAENTRKEYDAALQSIQSEFDIEIALTRELGKRYGLTFRHLAALRCQVAERIRQEDTDAEFRVIVSQLSHPSQDGAA